MRQTLILVVIAIAVVGCAQKKPASNNQPKNIDTIATINRGNVDFKTYFTDKTMRLDYYHTGNEKREHFAIDQVMNDGVWSGSETQLIDKLELGSYFFEVVDKASNILLYSRGFASIFGEWQSTPESKSVWGTFSESLRFPWPLKSVIVKLKKRDGNNKFETIWITTIDPTSRQVNPAEIKHTEKVDIIANNGAVGNKVDIVILGDGYAKTEMEKFRSDAKRLSSALLGVEPYRSRIKDINIYAVETPAEESGVTMPHHGIYKRSPLSTHYSSFDSERYVLSYDNKTIRNVASSVPYDFMVILINERTYGGGGIYNLYTTVAADNRFSSYIMIHELGHHLAALADEYYTSSVAYETPKIIVEPWEPNITALLDKNNLKWKDLVTKGTPIPTPWNKEQFDKYGYHVQKTRDSLRATHVAESVMEDLFLNQKKMEVQLFDSEKYKDVVGAFEGAGYVAKGLYRPQIDCIMFTRHEKFCKVCQRSISNVLDEYTR
jgi:IgA Peptidase M64.